jgi:hypothetical protein
VTLICFTRDCDKKEAQALVLGWRDQKWARASRIVKPHRRGKKWRVELYQVDDAPHLTSKELIAIGFTRIDISPEDLKTLGCELHNQS